MKKLRFLLFVVVIFAFALPADATAGYISTLAGGGVGDGGAARAAVLNGPWGLTQDVAGNIFVAEGFGNRIRKVTPSGVISTFAGTGETRSYGDGGPAALAGLWFPVDVVVAPDGALFVAESYGRRVRRIDPLTGIISTVAGNGTYSGSLGDGAQATSATISPRSLAVDGAGNLFIGENVRVRRVDAVTGIITTVAGNGLGTSGCYPNCPLGGDGSALDARIQNVDGLVIDSQGNLYIADAGSYRVRKVDANTGVISTIAGNGAYCCVSSGKIATETSISSPGGMSFDSTGNLYIASYYVVIKLDAVTGRISVVAGNGSPNAPLSGSRDNVPAAQTYVRDTKDVIVTSSGVVFTDIMATPLVRSVDSLGFIHTIAGNATYLGDGGPASNASLAWPGGAAMDAAGSTFVADTGHNRVRKIDPFGKITTFAGGGTLPVLNSGDGGPATSAVLDRPYAVDVDLAGNVYIAETYRQRVRKVAPDGTITTVAGPSVPGTGNELGLGAEGLGYVFDVEVAPDGSVFIAALERVWRLTPDGAVTVAAGNGGSGFSGDGGPATEAGLNQVQGVAVDSSGNLYIADTLNHRIRFVSAATGIITTVAGSGPTGVFGGSCYPMPNCGDGGPATSARLYWPTGVDIGSDGTIYIADALHDCVRKVDAVGVISTISGTMQHEGFFGDGGPASEAELSNPRDVRFAPLGLIVSDTGNNRIRLVGT